MTIDASKHLTEHELLKYQTKDMILKRAGKIDLGVNDLVTSGTLTAFGGTISGNFQVTGSSNAVIGFTTVGDTSLGDGPEDTTAVSGTFSVNGKLTPLLFASGGGVGIGTDRPTQTLDVRGNTLISGTLTISGANTSRLLLPLSNDSSTPTLAFGDGNTGFYESSDNNLKVSIAGTDRFIWSDSFYANNAAGPGILNETTSSTNPTLTPNRADLNTGIGWNAADELSLITGGSELMRLDINDNKIYPFADMELGTIEAEQDSGAITLFNMPVSSTPTLGDEMSASFMIDSEVILKVKALADGTGGIDTKQVVIDSAGDFGTAAAPSLAFGDGDSGFYENGDDTILCAVGGSERFRLTATYFDLYNAQGATLLYGNPSATVPAFLPEGNDSNTGIGHAAADSLSLIAGAKEGIRLTESGDNILMAHPSAFQNNITAYAGGGQADATQIARTYNIVTVSATNGDSVKMPSVFVAGTIVHIMNADSAQTVDVFPASGDDLGAGADNAINIAAGESIIFMGATTDATWAKIGGSN